MAYEKQTWVTGDTITAAKLNHMEDGIAEGGGDSSIFKVIYTIAEDGQGGFTATCNHTLPEIEEAYNAGKYIAVSDGTAQFSSDLTFEEGHAYISSHKYELSAGSGGDGALMNVVLVAIAHEFSDNEETIGVTMDSGYVTAQWD